MQFALKVIAPLLLCGVPLMMAPTVAHAQDGFDFGEDETEDGGDGFDFGEETEDEEDDGFDFGDSGEDWGDDESGFSFGDDDVDDFGPLVITGLFVPTTAAGPEVADQLTNAMMDRLGDLAAEYGQHEIMSNDALRQEFEIMGAELAYECAFDPICLGRYGANMGADRIAIGRVVEERGEWAVTVTLFNVDDQSVQNYTNYNVATNAGAIIDEFPDRLPRLLNIRVGRDLNANNNAGISPGQRNAGIICAVAGVGLIATGALFGIQANGIENDLEDMRANPGSPDDLFTQLDANDEIERGRSKALLANVMMGSGVALAGVSVLLFLVRPGEDIDESAEREVRNFRPTFTVTPQFYGDGGGLLTNIEF